MNPIAADLQSGRASVILPALWTRSIPLRREPVERPRREPVERPRREPVERPLPFAAFKSRRNPRSFGILPPRASPPGSPLRLHVLDSLCNRRMRARFRHIHDPGRHRIQIDVRTRGRSASSSRIATLLNRPSKNAPRVSSCRFASHASGSFRVSSQFSAGVHLFGLFILFVSP